MTRGHSPFAVHAHATARVASAKLTIKALLQLRPQLYEQHLRELLTICLWKLTLAEGLHKHRTRYRSRAASAANASDLRHDHVVERKKLVQALLDNPTNADRIADKAVGCTVTRTEHQRLTSLSRKHPELDGWERYERAGIVVMDAITGLPRTGDLRS
jgi:hypothetical protein